MEVPHCWEQIRGEILFRDGIKDGVSDGNEGDFGSRVKGEDVMVKPTESKGTVSGDGGEKRVWD